jgi:transmembrane sensor
LDQEASELFVQRLQGEWTAEQQAALDARLGSDSAFAEAFLRAQASWASLEKHAEAPEIMRHREAALAEARRSTARRSSLSTPAARARWRNCAIAASLLITIGIVWQLSPYGYVPGQYRTGLGEQKSIELADHSRIALDSRTRLRVRYSSDARVIELQNGQAQFTVMHDPTRPFKVLAGDRAIVAVGTVFTVEYADREMRVATLEGRVAVTDEGALSVAPGPSSESAVHSKGARRTIELTAGQELLASEGGESTVIPQADLEAVTAWRQGKIILRTESLGDAIRRVNRYSNVQIEITDPELASRKISGVFEAGDTRGFIDAVERYLPVRAESTEPNRVVLRPR